VVALAVGCGGNEDGGNMGKAETAMTGTTTDAAAGTTVTVVTTVQTTVESAPPEPPASFAAFQTPSKNIGCRYFNGSVRCDVLSGVKPQPTGTCELDWVGFALERAGPAAAQCAGDTVYSQGSPVLAYGERWRRGGITCVSRETGLLCTNQDGRGFVLSRARSRAF